MRPLLLATLLLLSPLAATAAEPAAQPEGAPPDAAAADEAAAAGEKLDQIDQILQGEEDVFLDTGYTYDPGDRRDPFKSLLAQQEMLGPKGVRPEGVPGLLIDEVTLTGIFRTGQGFIAQVQAADKDKSYLLKIGDQLYDGDVVSITGTEVVFKKIVNDPTRLKPFVEVVKKLSP
jgi:hypothetical protein